MGLFSSKPNIQKLTESGDIAGLKAALEHKDVNVRTTALEALKSINSPKAQSAVKAYIRTGKKLAEKALIVAIKSYLDGALKISLAFTDEALSHAPDLAGAWYHKSILLFTYRNNRKEALIAVEKAIELAPKYIEAWKQKARFLEVQQLAERLECYNRVLEVRPGDIDGLTGKAQAVCALGRHEEAIALSQKAIKKEPDSYKTWFAYGNILYATGQNEEAEKAYTKFLKLAEAELEETGWTFEDSLNQESLRLDMKQVGKRLGR